MNDATDTDVGRTQTEPTSNPPRPEGRIVRKGEADPEAIVDAIQRTAHPNPDDILQDGRSRSYADRHFRLPRGRLPGFGKPEDDCGEYVLPAMRFCTSSGKTHEFKHNCLRYDCPQHAPYAIRRRIAGSNSNTGMAPQLKSLISWLYAYRDTNHHFHHLQVSPDPGEPWYFESENPLERGKEAVRDIMDELGIQGAVFYHPFRGPGEGPEGDDRGWWKDNLFKNKDWYDLVDELRYEPHFHIVGVAPHVDVGVTEDVQEETGWVIHRMEDDEGRSIAGRDGDPTDSDDDAMCRTMTYSASHAMVYETDTGQRRLAAWMKGPDVGKVETYDNVQNTIQEKVYQASEKVLGISPPDLECSCRECSGAGHDPADDVDEHADGSVNMATMTKAASPRSGAPATSPFQSFGAAGGPASDGYELQSPPTKWKDFNKPAGSWKNASDPSRGQKDASGSGHREEAGDDQDGEKCGAYLKHISQAGEYLLDATWRESAAFGDDLEETYRNYVDYMTSRDLDPLEDAVPTLPEHDPPD